MTDSVCPTCLNLDYGRFKQEFDHVECGRPRYLVIEYDELRDASSAGCPICTILNQGCSLFWDSTPGDDRGFLYLKRCLGMGLLASQLPAGTQRRYWEFSGGNVIEFFTPAS